VFSAIDTVVVHVRNANDPPRVSAAKPTSACLWPPNHTLVAIGIIGVNDLNTNATITIDQVTQDEPTNGLGDGDTAVDAIIKADGTVLLRAERSGGGDGRVHHVLHRVGPRGQRLGRRDRVRAKRPEEHRHRRRRALRLEILTPQNRRSTRRG
jgi:hypothetical protein